MVCGMWKAIGVVWCGVVWCRYVRLGVDVRGGVRW